jgi:hypothetical protein
VGNGFGIFRSMEKTAFLGLKQFALSQSSFLAIFEPLIGIDQNVQCGRLDPSRLCGRWFLRLWVN